jgi:crotonobetainyl-CoA:carnitine CoA-transferase CaiB-like acyl-CoA transferase
MANSAKPLEGIRVVDLTMWFQGPVAAQHLADLGAEVIKIENPKGGDLARGVRSIKALAIGDWNQYFQVINRNKKSMAVDLNKPEGVEVIHKLCESADVFLTNLSSKALGKWHVSYDELAKINPKLVYAMGSGYGPHGNITKPSFDMTVQALIGLMTRQGEPGQPPVYLGMGSGDAMGGMMAALGIMIALFAREETGRGQFLDASLYGAQLFMSAPTFQGYLATGSDRFSRQRSRKEPDNPLTNTYEASDGWMFLCADNDDAAFEKVCGALGVDGSDVRFATAEARFDNSAALVELLETAIASKTAEACKAALDGVGIPSSPIVDFSSLAEDPGAWENDYFLKAHCSEVNREVEIRGLPVTFGKTPGEVETLGPELGQDTEMLLFEALGYDWDKIGELKAAGVIL